MIAVLVFFLGFVANAKRLELTIVHTNDIHSHYDPFNKQGLFCNKEDKQQMMSCKGGVSKIQTLINNYRTKSTNFLLLDGGDQFQGTQFYSYFKGNATADVMNYMHYNLTTVGNHEFDDGPNNLVKYHKMLQFPIVCANVLFKNKKSDLNNLVKPYHIFDNIGIGVIGYITPDTKTISMPGKDIEFLDAVQTVQHYIEVLKNKGINRIFGLSHYGYDEDMDLARKTRGLDLIVGGHSHSFLSSDPKDKDAVGPYPTVVKNLDNKNVYVVQSHEWGKHLGHIDVVYDDDNIASITGAPIPIDSKIEDDKGLQNIVDGYRRQFDAIGRKVIGKASENFSSEKCRVGECSMGDLTCDAMVEKIKDSPQYRSKILISITNGAGVRGAISKGDIKIGDMEIIFPFRNTLSVVRVTGKELNKIMEGVVKGKNLFDNKPITRTAQFSGIKIEYSSKDKSLKKILVKLPTLNNQDTDAYFWEVLDLEKDYYIVVNDYVRDGGDSILPTFNSSRVDNYAYDIMEIMVDYIRRKSPISPSPLIRRIDVDTHQLG